MNWGRNGLDEELPRQDVMTIARSRGSERKLRRDGTEKKREQKKDWTKKKLKEITEVGQVFLFMDRLKKYPFGA